MTHPTAKEGLPHLRQPFSVYGRSLLWERTGRRGGAAGPCLLVSFLAAARLLRPWGAAPSRLTALSSAGRCPPGTSAPASFLKKGCYVPVGRCPTADRVGRREEQKLYVRFPFITLFLRLKAILQLYGAVEHQRAGLGVLIVHAEVALPQELIALPGLGLRQALLHLAAGEHL